ncbi:MAG: LemA family protein [Ignavibacteria bacterium]|jgi:LemA protein|nr:LemA family protein [Ignavibacteria bacterium]MBK7252510.1 LemA family protein [Ignavibacteria bacterium]MBK7445143.1 LemA family protein [Ignavibacteria bacterium]MBK8383315.1 LemA family protein [Ignavibacteria bacterium]MBK9403138.1 LemA family protein [Ignavibacteria bacterium]
MRTNITKIIFLLIVFIFSSNFYGCGYNTLVTMQESVTSAWSQVENQYQRRSDLIPNLVKTVQGAADFEKSVLTEVTDARSRVGQMKLSAEDLSDPQKFEQFQKAQDQLSSALSRLLVVSENYPQLKTNESFLQLQSQLEGTENRISVERKRFNETVQVYNTEVKSFPSLIMAKIFGFKEKEYFKAVTGSEKAPDVNFDFKKKEGK